MITAHPQLFHGRGTGIFYRWILWALTVLPLGALWAQVPGCTNVLSPSEGETGVGLSTEVRWEPVANATGYSLFIGTRSGSWDVVDGTDVGNTLTYTPPSGWNPNTTYFVMVLPRNNTGAPPICPEQRFTTGEGDGIPGCVTLQEPLDGSYGVSPSSLIRWFPQVEATGYLLSIGTSSGFYDILDQVDVGNVTEYDLPASLPAAQRVYIRVTPYNAMGESPVCSEDSFRTRGNSPPSCTETIDPRNGDQFVSVTANITWIRDFSASGYRMTIEEKEPGGVRLLDNEFVGTGTNYKPPNFKPNTTYFVTIVPFNDLGPAANCIAISFTTGDAPPPPACSSLIQPGDGNTGVAVDTELIWDFVNGAEGYVLSVGTSRGNYNLINQLDLGPQTTYSFANNLPEGSRIYVRVVPYNSWGAAEGCPEWSFTTRGKDVTATDLPIPKFFTPNNDGFNDTWTIAPGPELAVEHIRIFNRFGQLIKQLAADQAWDGNFNGRPMASDSYWYRIRTIDGKTLTGFLLLKR